MRRNDLIRGTIAALILLSVAHAKRDDRPQTDTARKRATLEKLEMKVPLRFAEPTPLIDVVKYIRSATQRSDDAGIPFFLDPESLREAGKTIESPVTCVAEGKPLETTLRELLRPLDLDYTVRDDGIVAIARRANGRRE
jgi:hypothetical protein